MAKTNVLHCPAPYEWVPSATIAYASRKRTPVAGAARALAVVGLQHASGLRVLKTTAAAERVDKLGQFVVDDEFLASVATVVERVRAERLERAANAAADMLEKASAARLGVAHRAQGAAGEQAVIITIAGNFPESLIRVADEASEITVPAVIRALIAEGLEREGFAPPRWREDAAVTIRGYPPRVKTERLIKV